MKTIYLIRHSAPFIDIDNYQDYLNVPFSEYNKNMILSVKGEENAKKLCNVEELKDIKEIYASNSSRAISTAKYIAEMNNIKIKLDDRINERKFGVKYLNELPDDYTKKSFDDKNFKIKNGESLNEVDKRFSNFIDNLLDDDSSVIIVIHGIMLLSYLQKLSSSFSFDGDNFKIIFKDKIILDAKLKSPDIYKLNFDDDKKLVDINNVKCS